MKLIFLILCVGFVSVAVFGRDLSSIARKERARRQSIRPTISTKVFTNADLDVFAEHPNDDNSVPKRETRRSAQTDSRDLRKEELFWRGEKLRNDRELARVDANIRRLEWRLRDRRLKSRTEHRLRDDPSVTLLEESLDSLREQRDRLESEFLDHARKAGAFPGWLR